MKTTVWMQRNTKSLVGKTVAISGATGGIGRELCAYLATLGAELVLLDRNMQKSNALRQRLQARFPALSVRHLQVDLSDMASVREAARRLQDMSPDALILNAGAYHIPRYRCDTGLDNVFQINFAAPYYLARSLMPSLRARGGRVVAVSSIAHNYSRTRMDDMDFSQCAKASKAYGNAKRFLTFALYGLFGREGGLAVTHPGITLTGITDHYPKWIYAIIRHPMKVIFMKPKRACLSILRGLFEDCDPNEWIGPRWFGIWGLPKKTVLRTCSEEEAKDICRAAENLYKTLSREGDCHEV